MALVVIAGALFGVARPASAAYEGVPTPTVEGPIPVTESSYPFLASDIPLGSYGYQEDEYFLTGTGYTYNTGGAVNVTGSKILTGGPNSNGTYPYKTRIVVRRPSNPANFNGKVVVEWQNVTAGYDLEANWFGDPYYLLRNGYAWVGVSAQAVGTNYLKNTFDPTRYAGLEVGPAGDGLSYDIYASAIKAIRGFGTGPQPLGGLTANVSKVTASGESQSCGRLVTYYNKVAPLQEIADNYLLTVCTGAIRADRPEKVLRIISEFENKAQQTEAEAPSNPALRHWEAAGGSHVPYLANANWSVAVDRDTGVKTALCSSPPLSRVQWPYLVNAGTKELDEWSEGGSPPPLGPRGEYVNPTTLKRDANGNALGGVRLPDIEVATGVNRGDNTAAPPPNPYNASAFCTLLGQYKPFSPETLGGLYTDYGDYIAKVKAFAETKRSEGFLLPEDVTRIVESAEEFPGLRPTAPVLTGASPSMGNFQLDWRGAVPSHEMSQVANTVKTEPKFELQHRNASGEWTPVGGELGSPSQSFANEQEGTWEYRVRSKTVIPAYKIEPEQTVITPWSDTLEDVVVDQSAPGAPTASADRSPEYAGAGGWWKDTVTVSFADNGDPLLSDGSPGSGVNPSSIPASQTFSADGSYLASGTVTDNAGNISEPGSLAVQVDASAPSAEASCPAPVSIGAKGVNATVTALDGQSGLAKDPSGSYPIDTSTAGVKTVEVTAIDNVGHETTASCSTLVGYTQVITTNVKDKLVVKSGEAIELTKTAKVSGKVTVKAGGALDIEGATVSGPLTSKGAALIRICGGSLAGATVSNSTGSVVIGEGNEACGPSKFGGKVTIKSNKAGVLVDENTFGSFLKVKANSGGTTVVDNTVAGELNVTTNTGTVVDKPNSVEGKSKLQ